MAAGAQAAPGESLYPDVGTGKAKAAADAPAAQMPARPQLRSWAEVTDEQQRLERMIAAAVPMLAEGEEEGGKKPMLGRAVAAVLPCVAWSLALAHWSLPLVRFTVYAGIRAYELMPKNLIKICVGSSLCLFGGTFPTIIAAWEAALNSGWQNTKACLRDVWQESERLVALNEEDDRVDADGDGVADVKQISAKQLVARKLHLFFDNADAQKLNRALKGLYTSATAVCVVLRAQFARTIALSVSISKFLRKPTTFLLTPSLHYLSTLYDGTPHYQQWTPLVIDYTCKTIGLTIAWKIQSVLSAFHSAVKGGLLVSQGLILLVDGRLGWGIDLDKTSVDDILGSVIGGAGFYYQLKMGFALPSPLNIILIPFRVLEKYIQYHITYGAPGAADGPPAAGAAAA